MLFQSLDWIIRNKVVSTEPVVYNIYIFIYMNSPNLSVNVIRIQIFNCRSGVSFGITRSRSTSPSLTTYAQGSPGSADDISLALEKAKLHLTEALKDMKMGNSQEAYRCN